MNYLICMLCLLVACKPSDPTLKVAATLIPHTKMLEEVKDDLKAQGINLEIITVEDYQTPNRALADHEVDANFFQHIPFLNAQTKQFNYPITSVAAIHIEPLGGYSKKMTTIQPNSLVALPLDPTNQARALLLLSEHHLISLDDKDLPSVLDIRDNPEHLRFIEVDAAMLARTLEDVDLAFIPTNYALQAGLSPKDALIIESATSPYANILVVRKGEEDRKDIQALIYALKSEKMKNFILAEYGNSIFIIK